MLDEVFIIIGSFLQIIYIDKLHNPSPYPYNTKLHKNY